MADPKIVLSAVDRTGAAFASAKKNLEGLMKSAEGLGARFGTIGVAITGALTGASLQGAIDVADNLGKLSQRTGIAVEDLSTLRYAANLAGVSYEELDSDLKKFSLNIAAGARGSEEQVDAFNKLGISQKFLQDNIGDTKKVLDASAEGFAKYADGPNKIAIANGIGGKSFEKLIPLLNGGRQGLQDAREELEKFGGVIGSDLAGKAERFNDNLTKIQTRLEGAKLAIADGLLPELISLSDAFLNAKTSGDGLIDVLDQLAGKGQDFIGKLAGKAVNLLLRPESVEQLTARTAIIKYQIENLNEALQQDPGQPVLVKRLEELKAALAGIEERGRAAQRALEIGGGRGTVNPANVVPDAPPKKPDAPALKNGAAPDQVQLLRAQLQRREQIIQQSLSNEQDIIRFTERFVQEAYRSGTVSLEATFQAEAELRRRNVEEVRRASEETIKAEQQFQASLPKPKNAQERQRNQVEVENSNGKIAEAQQKIAAAERDAQQQGELAAVQNEERRQRLRQEVEAFNAAITDLADGGRARAGELQEIATKVKAAEDLLVQGGASRPEAQAQGAKLGALLEQQRQFNLLRDEFSRITDRARDAEEALLLAQQRGGDLVGEQQQLFELRKQELAQLDALIEKTRELAKAAAERNGGVVPDNLADDLRRIELQRQRLSQNLDPQRVRAEQSADNIGDAIAEGLSRAIVEGEKLSDVINAIGKDILAIVTREVITEPLAKSISGLIKSGFQDGGGNILEQIFGGGAPPLGEVAGIPAATQAVAQAPVVTAITTASTAEITALTTAITTATATETAAMTATSSAEVAALSGVQATGTAAVVGAIGASTAAIVSAILAKGATDALSGVAALGGAGFGGGDGFGFLFHEGGVAGQGGERRTFSLSVFDSATRYHTGGIAGAPADAPAGTLPVVLQAGEEVIAPSDPRHRDRLGSALSAADAIARGNINTGGVVRPVARVEGLAADEVPAFLPPGYEVLTADDPRHIDNFMPSVSDGTVLIGATGARGAKGADGAWWSQQPKFHSGGVIGSKSFMQRTDSVAGNAAPAVVQQSIQIINSGTPKSVRTEQRGQNLAVLMNDIEEQLGSRVGNGVGPLYKNITSRYALNGGAGPIV